MTDQVESAAAAIASVLAPQPPAQYARWRWGTVSAVNSDGTMDVSVGGATMPSVRCAVHATSAAIGDRVRVAYQGTDAIVDAVRAVSNYPLLLRSHGTNPVTTTASDTQSTWAAMGSGLSYYNAAGQLNGQPAKYGLVLSVTNGYDVAQVFKEQRDGGLFIRGGNQGYGLANWHVVPHVTLFGSSSGTATITLPYGKRYLLVSTHNSTTNLNGIAIVTGSTVYTVAGASGITYSRNGLTITATTGGGNPNYYLIPLE